MDILIIDDDPEDTSFFCEAVNELMPSINCIVENNSSNIDNTIGSLKQLPKLIFIDGFMYPLGGKECLIKIKKLINNTDTRIIIYSGSVSERQTEEFKALGADEVMVKAGNFESLKLYLSKVFEMGKALIL